MDSSLKKIETFLKYLSRKRTIKLSWILYFPRFPKMTEYKLVVVGGKVDFWHFAWNLKKYSLIVYFICHLTKLQYFTTATLWYETFFQWCLFEVDCVGTSCSRLLRNTVTNITFIDPESTGIINKALLTLLLVVEDI